MSITRWDPFGDIVSLREAMNNLLEESFVRPRPGASQPGAPAGLALDVRETPEAFVISASVPGVPAENVEITVLGDTLRIRGERHEERTEDGQGQRWLLRERRFGAFERTVALPTTVKADAADADFKDGVLTITLPKAEEAKPRSIPVRGATGSAAQAQPVEIEAKTDSSQSSS
jgi:HSP20 family protein